MPAKFQLNTALTHEQRTMFDQIFAGGRGPQDQVVVKMLIGALEDYWKRFGVLPSPMRLVADVKAERLHGAAEDAGNYEQIDTTPAGATRLVAEDWAGAGKVAALAAQIGPTPEQMAADALRKKRAQPDGGSKGGPKK